MLELRAVGFALRGEAHAEEREPAADPSHAAAIGEAPEAPDRDEHRGGDGERIPNLPPRRTEHHAPQPRQHGAGHQAERQAHPRLEELLRRDPQGGEDRQVLEPVLPLGANGEADPRDHERPERGGREDAAGAQYEHARHQARQAARRPEA